MGSLFKFRFGDGQDNWKSTSTAGKDGLADNTIVMFFGDNGRIEPRGIHWCYDTGIHVPMIIRWPKDFTARQTTRRVQSRTRSSASLISLPQLLALPEFPSPLVCMEGFSW